MPTAAPTTSSLGSPAPGLKENRRPGDGSSGTTGEPSKLTLPRLGLSRGQTDGRRPLSVQDQSSSASSTSPSVTDDSSVGEIITHSKLYGILHFALYDKKGRGVGEKLIMSAHEMVIIVLIICLYKNVNSL